MYPQKISSQCQSRTQLLGHGSCHLSGLSDAKPGLEMKSTKSLTKWISHVDFQCWKEWMATSNRKSKKFDWPFSFSRRNQHFRAAQLWQMSDRASFKPFAVSRNTTTTGGVGAQKIKRHLQLGHHCFQHIVWVSGKQFDFGPICQSCNPPASCGEASCDTLQSWSPMTQNQGVRQKWVSENHAKTYENDDVWKLWGQKNIYIYIYVMIHKLAIN